MLVHTHADCELGGPGGTNEGIGAADLGAIDLGLEHDVLARRGDKLVTQGLRQVDAYRHRFLGHGLDPANLQAVEAAHQKGLK